MNRCLLAATVVTLCAGPVDAGETVLAVEDSALIAPSYVHFMTRGAPSDSFALRISLCSEYALHTETHSWLVIDELVWPAPQVGLDFDPATQQFSQEILKPAAYCRGIVVIDGSFFCERARAFPRPQIDAPKVRYRAGELYVRGVQPPLEFVRWRSPIEFVVRCLSVDFVLRRVSGRRYELIEMLWGGEH